MSVKRRALPVRLQERLPRRWRIAAWAEKGSPLFNEYLGEIKVVKYNKRLKEEFLERQGH